MTEDTERRKKDRMKEEKETYAIIREPRTVCKLHVYYCYYSSFSLCLFHVLLAYFILQPKCPHHRITTLYIGSTTAAAQLCANLLLSPHTEYKYVHTRVDANYMWQIIDLFLFCRNLLFFVSFKLKEKGSELFFFKERMPKATNWNWNKNVKL